MLAKIIFLSLNLITAQLTLILKLKTTFVLLISYAELLSYKFIRLRQDM